tara:strand:- start:1705 stop:2154 length:450 start_codon:yes stop_codon:yes gene_type:complete
MAIQIGFLGNINPSLQIGDMVYYADNISTNSGGFETGDTSGVSTNVAIGVVSAISTTPGESTTTISTIDEFFQEVLVTVTNSYDYLITIDNTEYPTVQPTDDDFIYFVKDNSVNLTSITGYYGEVEFKNNSTEKAELFAASCEIVESSK